MGKISDMTGNMYKVLFEPEFTEEFKLAVKNNVYPAFVSDSETEDTGLYTIDDIGEFLRESSEEASSSYHLTETDLKLFNYIRKLKVEYIEF